MARLMLIDGDPVTLITFGHILRMAGHWVVTASSGRQGLDLLQHETIDLIFSDLRLPDMSGLEILGRLRDQQRDTALVIIAGVGSTHDAVTAMRLGAVDFLEKPISEESLLRTVQLALGAHEADGPPASTDHEESECRGHEAHAAARWARVIVPIIESPQDPRTILDWSRIVFSSAGALRNWCRMAGISPRRSLVFGRLLRAVFLAHGGKHKLENLLDVVDRRTLNGLLHLAGLNPQQDFPNHVDTFLDLQVLVRDPDALYEIRRTLAARASHPASVGGAAR